MNTESLLLQLNDDRGPFDRPTGPVDGARAVELKGLAGLQRVFTAEWEPGDPARARGIPERSNGASSAHPVASFPHLAAQLR